MSQELMAVNVICHVLSLISRPLREVGSRRYRVGNLGVGSIGIVEVARNRIPPIKGEGPRALGWSHPCESGFPQNEMVVVVVAAAAAIAAAAAAAAAIVVVDDC